MALDAQIEKALKQADPSEVLAQLAQGMLVGGASLDAVQRLFTQAHFDLRAAGREADEEIVLDILDRLVGWCGAHARIEAPRPVAV